MSLDRAVTYVLIALILFAIMYCLSWSGQTSHAYYTVIMAPDTVKNSKDSGSPYPRQRNPLARKKCSRLYKKAGCA